MNKISKQPILDLSVERKKREKEIEEARKKMKEEKNLRIKNETLKKIPAVNSLNENESEKQSLKKSKQKIFNFVFFKPKQKVEGEILKENKKEKIESEILKDGAKEKIQKQKLLLKICNFFISTPIYLLVFLIPLFFLPFTLEIFEFNKQYLLWFLTNIALMAWLIKMAIVKKEFAFLKNPLNIPILILIAIFGLSTFFSIDRYSSIWGAYGWSFGNLLEILCFGALFFVIINNIKKTNLTINRLLNVFLISGFFVVLISYFSIFGFFSKWIVKISWLNDFLSEINLSNFNLMGSWEALSIFLTIIIVLILGKKSQNALLSIINYLLLIAGLFLLIIINFTLAWIILLITLGLLFFFKIKETKNENFFTFYLIIITCVICVVSLFSPLNKFIKIDLFKEKCLSNKTSWQITKNVVKNYPILGAGPNTFIYNFSKFHSKEFNQNENWQIRFGKSGNYISELINSIGILGILVYLILIGILFNLICRLPFIICYFPVFSLFLAQFFYSGNILLNFCFWFFLSLSIANWKKIKPEIFKTQKFGHNILKNVPELSVILNSILVLIFFVFIGISYFAIQNYKAEAFIKNKLKSQQQTKNFLDQKIEIFKQASNLNPKQIYYQINLIYAYLDKILSESQNLKNQQTYEKAKEIIDLGIQKIKEIQKIAPFNVKVAEIQGQFYRDIKTIVEGTIPLSIEGFTKAIKLEPANPSLRTELGKMYMNLAEENKNKEKSKNSVIEENLFIKKLKEMDSSKLIQLGQKEFQKALELKKDFWLAELYLDISYERQGDILKAVSDLEKLVITLNKNKQDQPEVFFELGKLYFNQEKTDEAIKAFEMAIRMIPDYSNALYGLAISYEKKELYNQALEIFQKLQQLNPENEGVKRKILELKMKITK